MGNIEELAIHGVSVRVRAVACIARQADHSRCHHALPLNRLSVVAALPPKRFTRLVRSGERIEALNGPIVKHAVEDSLDILRREGFQIGSVCLAVGRVAQPHKKIDRAVMIYGSQHIVEIDCAIEKSPCDVPHQRAQKRIDGHEVPAKRIVNVGEILIALESEFSECEGFVTQVPPQCWGFDI